MNFLFPIKLALAGLSHLIVHWGLGLIIIAACIAIEFGAGFIESEIPILKGVISWLQKYVLFVAVGTALILLGEWIGAKDIADRCGVRAAVVDSHVDSVVTKSHTETSKGKAEDDNL